MTSTELLRAEQLCAAAAPLSDLPVLKGISFSLQAGEQVALIGASGAGKTTLLQTLALAQRPLSGSLHWQGRDPWVLARRQRQRLRGQICLAPQSPPLPPRQRVVSAVLAGLLPQQSLWQSLRTLWNPPQAGRAFEALNMLDVGDKLWLRVDRLSGGERQRVGLARLLVADAQLWMADEPLAALDPARASQALQSLQLAARQRGIALLCSLHQVELARSMFPRILALQDGELVYDGPSAMLSDELLQQFYGGDAIVSKPQAQPQAGLPGLPQAMCR